MRRTGRRAGDRCVCSCSGGKDNHCPQHGPSAWVAQAAHRGRAESAILDLAPVDRGATDAGRAFLRCEGGRSHHPRSASALPWTRESRRLGRPRSAPIKARRRESWQALDVAEPGGIASAHYPSAASSGAAHVSQSGWTLATCRASRVAVRPVRVPLQQPARHGGAWIESDGDVAHRGKAAGEQHDCQGSEEAGKSSGAKRREEVAEAVPSAARGE